MTSKSRRVLAVQYGDQRLEFDVVTSHARPLSVRISVDPLSGVRILAPPDASDVEIRATVRKRAKWIYKHLRPQQGVATRKRAISGEEALYLGRRYLLKVDVGHASAVKLKGGALVVHTLRRDPVEISKALDQWYSERAREYFSRRIEALFSPAFDGRRSPPDFRLRRMRRQWGSCSPAGNILLNPLLVRAPRACVDYVIAHELSHLKYHDHSPDYYRLLSARMPDWQERKAFLDLVAGHILD